MRRNWPGDMFFTYPWVKIRAMSLKSWLSQERGRSKLLAEHLKVPQSFVSRMAAGDKPVPIEHGAAVELFTGGAFSRRENWPDCYARIWPDLADEHGIEVERALPPTAPAGQGVAHA